MSPIASRPLPPSLASKARQPVPTTLPRARVLLLFVAVSVYANSLGNGFTFDDNWLIVENPVVTEGRVADAFTAPYWRGARPGTGNYRPLMLASFGLEWAAFDGSALGFHVVSVLAHALICLLVLALLTRFVPIPAAFLGALLFAVHPVHVEAVANVVGRAELYAALAYLGACLLYLDAGGGRGPRSAVRLLGLIALFVLSLGGKEMAITLPGVLFVLELSRRSEVDLFARLRAEFPTYVALTGTFAIYVLVRGAVLGDLIGESPAAGLASLSLGERLLTALTVWPQYLRLMVFPLDLSADYAPGVFLVTTSLTVEVVVGAVLLLGIVVGAWLLRDRSPTLALGLAWFFVAVLPVSNLIVRSDVLLAERTLYLPSVAVALVLAGLAHDLVPSIPLPRRRALSALVGVALVAMTVRTVTRNPTWLDTFTMLNTLAVEHPESSLALRARARGFERVGEMEQARQAFELALAFAPDNYQIVVEAAVFYSDRGQHARAEELFASAISLLPDYPAAHIELATQRLLRGEGRAAHAAALSGLAAVGSDRELWFLVSESYVAKGDLAAAIHAGRAALGREPDFEPGWARLAELLELDGREEEARAARRRASQILTSRDSGDGA